jgi:predicted Ser/Thr protein kinase
MSDKPLSVPEPPGPERTSPPVTAHGAGSTQRPGAGGLTQSTAAQTGPLPAVPGYEVLEELGRGGMGVVFKARHAALGRVVALKMILAGAQAAAPERGRFLAEARAVARLSHPGIVPVYEVGEHQGCPYFSLEFIAGGTLAQRTRGQPMPPRQAAVLVEQLARAVDYAHEHGVVHRDLKPQNVLLTSGKVVPRIADFGLAKVAEDATEGRTQTGMVLGTPSYMAPEQARGDSRQAGPPADIWALGAILYELLTGRPPFKADTTLKTLGQVLHDDPVSPRKLQPRVSRDLETVCLKCLEKDPARRYASAAALADDLLRFLAGRPVLARPLSAVQRLGRRCRRHPVVAALTAACLLALVGGLIWRQTRPAWLELRVTPETATVLLDGRPVALESGSARLRHAPGTFRLVAQAEDHLEKVQAVKLERRRTTEVRIRLIPRHGKVLGTSQPEGAAVEVRDARGALVARTSTPMDLRLLAGRYTARLSKELYEPTEVHFTVAGGKETKLPVVKLKGAPGSAESQPLFALVDRLKATRWSKFDGVPARQPLRVFLERVARQIGKPILLNTASLKQAGVRDAEAVPVGAMPALRNVSVETVLRKGLAPLDLTFVPRLDGRGGTSLEVLTTRAAARLRYTILHDVRDLLGPTRSPQVLVLAIRQSVGTPRDWVPNYNPITGQPLNPDDEDEDPPYNANLGYLPPVQALAVTGPWRIQEGTRDYLRKLRVLKRKR